MQSENMIQSFNGVELRYRKDMADSQRAVAVITHGICEHLGRSGYDVRNGQK